MDKHYQERKKIVRDFRPKDDAFFHLLSTNKEYIEEMLQVIKEDENLKVEELYPQKEIYNLYSRKVIVDVLVEDGSGRYINIEIQMYKEDYLKRIRYHQAMLDVMQLEKGADIDELRDTEIIYITDYDPFGLGENIYHIHETIDEYSLVLDFGRSIILANCGVIKDTKISRYMQTFNKKWIDDDEFPNAKMYVNMYKEEGSDEPMCESVENYARMIAKEELIANVLRMKDKFTIEDISEALNYPISKVKHIISLNSTDIEYIYEQIK